MLEMFMIIFVLFIILGLGMYYFYKFSLSSIEDTGRDVCMQTSSQQLSSIIRLPETICTVQGISRECVDVTKLMAFKESTSVKAFARGVCKKSITFIQSYPPVKNETLDVECDGQKLTSPDFPSNCGKWTVYDVDEKTKKEARSKPVIETPVSLYFPTLKEFRIGKLQLRMYIK
ncbi:MAG: hypothetical protein AABY09_04985 [Nanoarchaeota archaeon]